MIQSPCFSHRRLNSKRGGCAFVLVLAAMVSQAQPSLVVAQSVPNASHSLLSADEPPGSLGFKRRIAGGDIGEDFFQPVRLIVPERALVSPADSPADPLSPRQTVFGLHVGQPYRFMVSRIPLMEDLPLYPSIELIDRTYPPIGMETRFAIPIEITIEDLRQAAQGNYVQRVVYVEDPELALPISMDRDSAQSVYDVDMDEDPLAVAASLGRPVAILRLGSKSPDPNGGDTAFLFGSPVVQMLGTNSMPPAQRESLARQPQVPGRSESPILKNPRLRRILR